MTKAEHSYSKHQNIGYISPKEEPNTQYELLRRRIHANTKESWYFVNSVLSEIQKKSADNAEVNDLVKYLLSLGVEHKRSLLHDIEQLEEVDGYATWRENEANDLSKLVQARLHYLQNPDNCKTAKKLVCSLNKVRSFYV